jgi:Ca2+-binding EF-hand superfamily protein
MVNIFTGSYDKLIHFIFQIYDCDNDGEISKQDVKLILSYIPLSSTPIHSDLNFKFENESFNNRLESQEEINKYVNILFENADAIDEFDYKKIVNEKSSESFIYVND